MSKIMAAKGAAAPFAGRPKAAPHDFAVHFYELLLSCPFIFESMLFWFFKPSLMELPSLMALLLVLESTKVPDVFAYFFGFFIF